MQQGIYHSIIIIIIIYNHYYRCRYSGNNINSDPNGNTIGIIGNAIVNTTNNTHTNTNTSTPLITNKKSITSKNVTNNNNSSEITIYDYDKCLDKVTNNTIKN